MAIGNMITAEEAAQIIGVHRARVYQFANSGRLPGIRTANGWFFKRSDVRKFAEKPRKEGRPKKVSARG